ncbi:hypothetical protein MP478_04290 [Chryseobacterium sp. WG14]|uniref:hypothetical protein n=1 Tax=Chryseobacterium TaxID=59732 RepID=UPI00211EA7B4|nr:hypothetical protein [Chryseobacterium sp. WG14]MCQ9638599.1 hypothetical protein [Chryseobacterium sp. WG14]
MANCAKIINNSLFNCDNKATGGLEQTIKLINRDDILANLGDFTIQRTMSPACQHSISAYAGDPETLKAVTFEGIPSKQLLSASYSLSIGDYADLFTHTVNLFSQGMTIDTVCNLKALAVGAEVIAIVHQRDKGTDNKDAFWVYGFDNGLKIGEFTWNSNENNGNSIIPLASREPNLEKDPPLRLLLTDYTTTKAFFDSLGN